MPKKAKNTEETNTKLTTKATINKKSTPEKKSAKSKATSTKTTPKTVATTTAKKRATQSSTVTKSTKKSAEAKSSTVTKSAKKSAEAKSSTVTKSAKKSTTSKSTNSKTRQKSTATKTTKKSTSSKTKVPKQQQAQLMEYYDLPYRYNQTVVKILAQTPKMLFVYWDISDKDREKYKQHYGEDFFSTSRPVLIIHNETMNYSFEIEINDFANSWYIHVNDADCKYNVELGRRPNKYITNLKENYVYISSSNHLDAPNDHILFEKATPNIKYKNVKNNQINIKDFSNSEFIKQIMKTYSIKTIEELYEKLYSEDILEDLRNGYYNNPTSNTSSTFK